MGRFDEADEIVKNNSNIYYYYKSESIKQMHEIVRFYCENQEIKTKNKTVACIELEKRHFFSKSARAKSAHPATP
jgi:hypothetical protein